MAQSAAWMQTVRFIKRTHTLTFCVCASPFYVLDLWLSSKPVLAVYAFVDITVFFVFNDFP